MQICLLRELMILFVTASPAAGPISKAPSIDHEVKYKVISKEINSKTTFNTTIIYKKAPSYLSNPFND